MSKSFMEAYAQGKYFLQNPPIERDNFIKYCQKLGLMTESVLPKQSRDVPTPALCEFGDDASDSVFRSSIHDDIFDIRPELESYIQHQSLTSPLFDGTHPKTVTEQYYSTFQFIYVDKAVNNIDISDEDIRRLLKLTIVTQNMYMPHFRSSGKHLQFHGEDKGYWNRRSAFSLDMYLEKEQLDISIVLRWYKKLPELAKALLGIPRSDDNWIELWKSISWGKKDSLEGNVRRGIEYLQWALFLKAMLQDYQKGEVLDIDEVHNLVPEQILDYEPNKMDQRAMLLRASRNYFFTDPETGVNYYHDRYRRLNYLANSFGLEYQPKVILFVEGHIETKALPLIFERCGGMPGSFGIEIKSLDGVDNLRSTHDDIVRLQQLLKELNRQINQKIASKDQDRELSALVKRFERIDIITSNWEAFINFNLEKWQAIPFFLADNEGQLQKVLNTARVLKYQGRNMDVPPVWQYLWGITNNNTPLVGDSFELANFTNDEICAALNELYHGSVQPDEAQKLRDAHLGLGSLIDKLNQQDSSIKRLKLDVVVALTKNMLKFYDDNPELLPDRPVFDVIKRVRRIAALNHAPTNMISEVENRKAISEQIYGK
jgi:hypothetical protein